MTGGGIVGNIDRISSAAPITVTYDSDWSFDSTLQIAVCSDYDGTHSLGCTVQNLKVKYYYYGAILSVIDFSNQGFFSL